MSNEGLRERVQKFITYLGITTQSFEDSVGLSNGAVSKMGDNTRRKTIDKISNKYDELNSTWVLTGEGEMLKPKSENPNAKLIGGVYSVGERDSDTIMVHYVPVLAMASFAENLASGEEVKLEKIPLIPKANERNEADKLRVFEVEGDSMFPTIPSGSLILAKEIAKNSWHYAEGVVVAVYKEFVVVKRIARNCLLTDNYIVLKSDNEGYGEMIVSLADLRGLFKAKRIISSEIR